MIVEPSRNGVCCLLMPDCKIWSLRRIGQAVMRQSPEGQFGPAPDNNVLNMRKAEPEAELQPGKQSERCRMEGHAGCKAHLHVLGNGPQDADPMLRQQARAALGMGSSSRSARAVVQNREIVQLMLAGSARPVSSQFLPLHNARYHIRSSRWLPIPRRW